MFMKAIYQRYFTLSAPLWSAPFRFAFLAAMAFAFLAIGDWLLFLTGIHPASQHALSPVAWHFHEMLFGFGALVANGFLLTASQNWTKLQTLPPAGILLWSVSWLLIRLLLWQADATLLPFALFASALWWGISLFALARVVYLAKLIKRQSPILIAMSIMALLDCLFLWQAMDNNTALMSHIGYTTVLLFSFLSGVFGGRLIPFFTGRAIANITTDSPDWLFKAILVTSIGTILTYFLSHWFVLFVYVAASLLVVNGVLHFKRLTYWHSWQTRHIPLLWTLHLSYLHLSLGLVLFGVSLISPYLPTAAVLHLLSITLLGTLVTSIACRVSLGHTGNALVISQWMTAAMVGLQLAAWIRFLLPSLQIVQLGWEISGALWLFAMAAYVFYFSPILTRSNAA